MPQPKKVSPLRRGGYLFPQFGTAMVLTHFNDHWTGLRVGGTEHSFVQDGSLFATSFAFLRESNRLEALIPANEITNLTLIGNNCERPFHLTPVKIAPPGVEELATGCENATSEDDARRCLQMAAKLKVPVLVSLVGIRMVQTFGTSWINSLTDALRLSSALRRNSLGRLSVDFLRNLIPKKTTDPLYPLCFDFYCDGLGYNDATRTLCEADEAINSQTYWSQTNLGTYYYKRGEMAAADRSYKIAGSLASASKGSRVSPYNKGIFTWLSLTEVEHIAKGADEPGFIRSNRTVEHFKATDAGHLVHVVSADTKYFRLFGEDLISSSLKNGGDGFGVHINIVNPEATDIEILNSWRNTSNGKLGYSIEKTAPDLFDAAYYASSRYIALPDLFEIYRCPLLVTDIDMRVKLPWTKIRDHVGGADLGFFLQDEKVDLLNRETLPARPWSLAAGYFYAANSALGRQFAHIVSGYICAVFSPPRADRPGYTNWVIDQVAMRRALDYLGAQNPKIVTMNFGFMDAPSKSFQTKADFALTAPSRNAEQA